MVTETMKGHLGPNVGKKEVITAVCLGYGNRRTGHLITHGSRQQTGHEVYSTRGVPSAAHCEEKASTLIFFFSLGRETLSSREEYKKGKRKQKKIPWI